MKDVLGKINMYQEDYRKDVPVLTERIQTEMAGRMQPLKEDKIEQASEHTK